MIKHLPNSLTVLRILLVPVFAYLVLNGRQNPAIAVFLTAGATDAVDGFIARRYAVRSHLGELLDPFADKFLLTTSYLILTFTGTLPLWLCVPVVLRDVLMLSGIAAFRWAGKGVTITPELSGKISTALQTLTVLYAMTLAGRLPGAVFTSLAVVTAAATVYSGLYYAWRAARKG